MIFQIDTANLILTDTMCHHATSLIHTTSGHAHTTTTHFTPAPLNGVTPRAATLHLPARQPARLSHYTNPVKAHPVTRCSVKPCLFCPHHLTPALPPRSTSRDSTPTAARHIPSYQPHPCLTFHVSQLFYATALNAEPSHWFIRSCAYVATSACVCVWDVA